ncbi:MAG: DNA polymerase III subunit epsilon [Gammaproteobacteria bacterium]|nr:DNA polymerase III subunit epsilon [Gammaproteobacteria bacterium]MBU1554739.1 DNA polymerase III subunit epsilon [Gammaproteobacteria bacterium]MBU2070116.1 DNA polymerase III subunit epsilon [Gammaproteobacteria bacterium]MBU2183112.1 DNA polymerase III subunit epsilon [Gammaproteobacteria bacterium]MBU2205439.1 DNA polymerase III subunit epsilon [Gammaproteobacteria bacterium]
MLNWLAAKRRPIHQAVGYFSATPFPSANMAAKDARFLVLDFELTGLNPRKDHIVSIGWVPVHQHEIVLADARHYLINSPVSVGQSAVYHGLHDHQLKDAHELADVLTELLSRYAGYVFVAHHSQLDEQFLRAACLRCFGKTPRFKFIDTMQIEWQRLLRQGKVVKHDALKLPSCLKRHGLPAMANHHALEDAYSTALLLLSQLKPGGAEMTLADLYLLSR